MKRILFIASHRFDRAPGQRFRFEQYMSFLEENGFRCELSYLIDEEDDKVFYQPGNVFKKFLILRKGYQIRKNDLKRIDEFDVVFVFREALMTRSTKIERALKGQGAKVIFDFDDAIWLLDVSQHNRMFSFAKNPEKTSKLITLADRVIAGNKYLANYAKQFNSEVRIIPTTVDTDRFSTKRVERSGPLTIGWTGSLTTVAHLKLALPTLERIKKAYPEVHFRFIGDDGFEPGLPDCEILPWKAATEVEDLDQIDIGIMPLPEDEWAKGKCGLKGLTYMALEIPTIMSPVGVNAEIIEHGVNGMLASTEEEWYSCLSQLIEDESLRQRLGQAGKQTVVDRYSVLANREKYLEIIRSLVAG